MLHFLDMNSTMQLSSSTCCTQTDNKCLDRYSRSVQDSCLSLSMANVSSSMGVQLKLFRQLLLISGNRLKSALCSFPAHKVSKFPTDHWSPLTLQLTWQLSVEAAQVLNAHQHWARLLHVYGDVCEEHEFIPHFKWENIWNGKNANIYFFHILGQIFSIKNNLFLGIDFNKNVNVFCCIAVR